MTDLDGKCEIHGEYVDDVGDCPACEQGHGGSVALVAEPLAYTITESELREWQRHVREGMEPEVPFNRDNNKMLAAAYELRGNMLYYLNHRLAAILDG